MGFFPDDNAIHRNYDSDFSRAKDALCVTWPVS